jgi:class 3 adenylate cyclase/ligand-binding sensor domain-containing protein
MNGRKIWLIGVFLCGIGLIRAQSVETDIRVYQFEDGLSHRNVFSIAQDPSGYLWLATINGLNRFDGYNFHSYQDQPPFADLPVEFTSNLRVDYQGKLWITSPDFITHLDPVTDAGRVYQIKSGEIERRASLVPTGLLPVADRPYLTVHDELTGQNSLARLTRDRELQLLYALPGQYNTRPLRMYGDTLYFGAYNNELWLLDPVSGDTLRKERLPGDARIADFYESNGELYLLRENGQLLKRNAAGRFELLPQSFPRDDRRPLTQLLVQQNGNIWVGGFGRLLLYDAWQNKIIDFDASVRELVKNTCTYRQIFEDDSGTVWVATDFGAVKISRQDRLFTPYLSGGSEYCSNVYCSTRGITEDEAGRIYISYYNSIHVLNPRTNDIRPLFPTNDYFNPPFGLLYYDGLLYTGNGLIIDPEQLRTDSLFSVHREDLGAVARGPANNIWFGYEHLLFRYDPREQTLDTVQIEGEPWQVDWGTISYLLPQPDRLWIATMDNGIHWIDYAGAAHGHIPAGPTGLSHAKVNVIHAAPDGTLWLGTGEGLNHLDPRRGQVDWLDQSVGLPNRFINGILAEGDSCLWISTDDGLCRYRLRDSSCLNYYTTDGLTANEFNRISFYRSRDGRLYFGGLNGINAFYPDNRFLRAKDESRRAALLLTDFNYLDGATDSIVHLQPGEAFDGVLLRFRDRMFTADFSLADFRVPGQNLYSYYLEGFDRDWSPTSTNHQVRYTDLPAGKYTLRVRARAGREPWLKEELRIPIVVSQPYYRSMWFWVISAGLFAIASLLLARYRIYLSEQRRRELQRQVAERTQELARAKQQSEALLLNILPPATAEELKKNGRARAQRHEQVTVLFSDFENFTRIAKDLEPEQLVREIDYHFRAFDEITARHGLEKIKTIGDAYLCVGGLDGDAATGARAAVRAALDIQRFMARNADHPVHPGQSIFAARIGIHSGPIVSGVVGTHKFAYDIWGETVNIASRLETLSRVGKINVSETTRELLDGGFYCRPHGVYSEHETRLEMYWIEEESTVAGS